MYPANLERNINMKEMKPIPTQRKINARIVVNNIAKYLFFMATLFGLVVLIVLIIRVLVEGGSWMNIEFMIGKLSKQSDKAVIMEAILGTFWLMIVVVTVTMIFRVGTAIFLELNVKKERLQAFIQTNILNLAGVPSIVYGILGLTIFVRADRKSVG